MNTLTPPPPARGRGTARAALLLFGAFSAGCAGPAVGDAGPGGALGASSTATVKALYAVLTTSRGEIEVRLLPEEAPKAVANFTELAAGRKAWTDPSGAAVRRPLYDGTEFFRVVPGFMIQGGDPGGTGSGGPGYSFEEEIAPGRSFQRPGLVAMASSGPGSQGSQFFITVGAAPWLDGKHTVFGEVVRGLEVAQAIADSPRRERDASGRLVDRPLEPQRLLSVRVEER